jgi:hypothetical protein
MQKETQVGSPSLPRNYSSWSWSLYHHFLTVDNCGIFSKDFLKGLELVKA